MMKDIVKTSFILCSVLFFGSCSWNNEKKQYPELVKSELASGKRYDSIFFGIYLGMTGKEFFTHCWEMNKKGLFTDGRSNTAVLYRLNHNELKYPASMNFYPEMELGKINKMSVSFQYDAWAPWNKHLFADSLLHDVLNLYNKWYVNGNPFIKVGENERPIYVKVDGNRRITLRKQDDMDVKVEYIDLLAEQKMKK